MGGCTRDRERERKRKRNIKSRWKAKATWQRLLWIRGKNSETRKTGRSQKRFKSVIQTLLRGEKQMTSCQHLRSSFTPTRGINSKNIHPLMFSSSKSTQDPYLKVFIFSDLHIKLKAHSQGSNNSYPFTLDSHLKIINDQFKFPPKMLSCWNTCSSLVPDLRSCLWCTVITSLQRFNWFKFSTNTLCNSL